MEIQQAIEIRRSIRAYGDRPVEREKLEAVLRAGNQAPIFGRLHMSVFAGPEQLQAVDAAAVAGMARSGVPFLENLAAQEGYHPLYGAAALVVLSAPGGLDEKGFNMANVSCAAENMLLAAAGLGLGSCFLMGPMAAFSDPALRARPERPGLRPLVGVALSYAAFERPPPRSGRMPVSPGADKQSGGALSGGLRFIHCFICFQRRAWACWAPPS
ncbi:MAG: nitroreductase family protein [Flavonifractor plautii]